jgi:hypothetical protein
VVIEFAELAGTVGEFSFPLDAEYAGGHCGEAAACTLGIAAERGCGAAVVLVPGLGFVDSDTA